MIQRSSLNLALAFGIACSSIPSSAQAFDMDCKVILCLAAGFPGECSDAKSYMLKRLKKAKPPFGICTSDEATGEEYSVPTKMFTRTHPRKCVRSAYVHEGGGDGGYRCVQWQEGRQDGIIAITIPEEGTQREFIWWTRRYQQRDN